MLHQDPSAPRTALCVGDVGMDDHGIEDISGGAFLTRCARQEIDTIAVMDFLNIAERKIPRCCVMQILQKLFLAVYRIFLTSEFDLFLFPEPVPDAQENGIEFVLFQGLEKIILHTVFNGFLSIFKFPVTADDDAVQCRLQFPRPADQIDAAAAGHADICDQKLGLCLFDQPQGTEAVVSNSCDLIAHLFPVDQLLKKEDDFFLIVSEDDFQHDTPLPGKPEFAR